MKATTASSSPWSLSSSSSSSSGEVIRQQGRVLDDPSACRPIRKSLALVIASTVCVVAGLVLVLCVTVLYVTPTVKSQGVMCHVEGLVIRRQPRDDDDNIMTSSSMASVTSTSRTLSRQNSLPSVTTLTSSASSLTSSMSMACSVSSQTLSASLSSRDVMNLSSVGLQKESALCGLSKTPEATTTNHPVCLEIRVRYSLPDGSCRYGFLHRARYGNETVAEVIENIVCYCRDCCTSTSTSTGSVKPRSILRATMMETQSITSGDSLECFLRRHRGPIKTETTLRCRAQGVSVRLLNAMFWPTLLFVVGVVGMFFGWIHLSRDRYTKCNHQQLATDTNLRLTNLTDIA